MTAIGVDFGTTNSVVSLLDPNGVTTTMRYPFGSADLDIIRSVLCFWNEGTKNRVALRHAVGPEAIEAWLDDPPESRLMMSLKTYLAQRSFAETRVFGRPFTLEDLIALFLRGILPRHSAQPPGTVMVAGRPIRFAGDAPDGRSGRTAPTRRLRHRRMDRRPDSVGAGSRRIPLRARPQRPSYRADRGFWRGHQ
jgi:hypothetical chaperone protein